MKALKITIAVIALFAAIIFIGGAYLPKTYHLKRSIVINAKDSVIFKNISNFNEFIKWSAWSKKEQKKRFIIHGEPNTIGHLYQWEGKKTGLGQMQITSLEEPKKIEIEYEFVKPFPSTAKTTFTLEPVSEGTKVTWAVVGENSSVFERWAGLFMGNLIGGDFKAGLKSLKEKSEK